MRARTARGAGAFLALAFVSGPASGHAFGERYELPVPVWLFIVGGAVTVTLTFVVVAVFAREGAERFARTRLLLDATAIGRLLAAPGPRRAAQLVALTAALLAVAAGFAGTKDPNRNMAPTLVWIVWWVGFSYFVMLVGNPWPAINPWRTLHDAIARAPGRARAPWPRWAGTWPAALGLLLFGWIELVFPFRATPAVLAGIVIAYSVLTWAGMARYGPETWLANADPFHGLYDWLSHFAPLAATREGLVLRPPAAGLLAREAKSVSIADVAFLMAMLAIVLFDGLQGSKHWLALEDAVHALDPTLGSGAWIALHSAGLVTTWLAFLAMYFAACAAMSAAAGHSRPTGEYLRAFAPTLIPIAVGYHFAHSFTYLLVQGQSVVFLVSDPLGLGWNLFGTRDVPVDIAVIGTKAAWYVALTAIVAGHAISVFLAHVVAERMHASRPAALRALVPITVLMVLYTVISLQILAEPLVRYSGPQETII